MGKKSRWEVEAGVYGQLLMRFQSANRQILAHEVYAFKHWKKDPARAIRVMILNHFIIPSMVQTVANLAKHVFTDKDDDEIWNFRDYALAWVMGPVSGAIIFGPIVENLAASLTGYAPRMATLPFADLMDKAVREWKDNKDDFDQDFALALQLAALLMGGDAGVVGSAKKIIDQALGVGKRIGSL
jgi:hypothetical protein